MEETILRETEAFIRKSLSEEQLAVAVYLERKEIARTYAEQLRNQGNDKDAEKFETLAYTLQDILQEEEIHIGQFRKMLELFDISKEYELKGEKEGQEDIQKTESFISLANKHRRYNYKGA